MGCPDDCQQESSNQINEISKPMVNELKVDDIYEQNINFIIGSGASFGLFPTLAVDIKGEDGEPQTIETIATTFADAQDDELRTLLFKYYYKECIEPVIKFDLNSLDSVGAGVVENYWQFIRTLLTIVNRKNAGYKKANIFTTNYDGCLELCADSVLSEKEFSFTINDGAYGFRRRELHPRNLNLVTCDSGMFSKNRVDLPQLNVIHLHGSVYWYKENDSIIVDYDKSNERIIDPSIIGDISSFSSKLKCSGALVSELREEEGSLRDDEFWKAYNSLPIVNPTKWKFHETVFEECYYQMLRFLSYELEKPNSVLIVFGFSFADEHIYSLIQRSLSNPSLQVFILCYSESTGGVMRKKFKGCPNVGVIFSESGVIDFSAFNEMLKPTIK